MGFVYNNGGKQQDIGANAAMANLLVNTWFRNISRIGTFANPFTNLAGQTCFDKWYGQGSGGGSLGTVNFTFTTPIATLTFAAPTTGGTPNAIQQTIPAKYIVGGTYTLSWIGTAQAQINGGTWSNSPLTVTGVSPLTAMTIAFGTTATAGLTFSLPVLTNSANVVPTIQRNFAEDALAGNTAVPKGNFIKNPNFEIQTNWAGRTYFVGQITFDRWVLGGANGNVSTSAGPGIVNAALTTAGSYLQQTIDALNDADPGSIPAGEGNTALMLSWQGNVLGNYLDSTGALGPNWLPSPIAVPVNATGICVGYASTSGARTFGRVVLTFGTDVVPVIQRTIDEERAATGTIPVYQNKILNSSFAINTAGIASGANLSPGALFLDGWTVGPTGGVVTFTSTGGDNTFTAPNTSGYYITQNIAPKDIEGGTYILAWKGTGVGCINVNGNLPALTTSPYVVTGVPAGATVQVQLGSASGSTGTIIAPTLTNTVNLVPVVRRLLFDEQAMLNPLAVVPVVNKLLNSSFQFNSKAVLTGVSNVAGSASFDGWTQGPNNGAQSFTKPAGGDMTLTFAAAVNTSTPNVITYTVPPQDVEGGTYTLSWKGTATGFITVAGTAGTQGPSPQVVTGVAPGAALSVTVGTTVTSTATLTTPVLTNTSGVTPVIRRMKNEDYGALYGQLGPDNKLHNPGFNINQRGTPTTGSIATGTYFNDRWKAGNAAAATITMTPGSPYNQIAFTTGSIRQYVNGEDIEGGTYTVGIQSGAASARVSTDGTGTYQTVPFQVQLVAGTSYYVEFGIGAGGGFTNPYLVLGPNVVPKFRQPAIELALCMRMFQVIPPWGGVWTATTTFTCSGEFFVPMIITPTLTWKSGGAFNYSTSAIVTGSAVASSSVTGKGGYLKLTTGITTSGNNGCIDPSAVIWANSDN